MTLRNGRQTGLPQRTIGRAFWPGTETRRNVLYARLSAHGRPKLPFQTLGVRDHAAEMLGDGGSTQSATPHSSRSAVMGSMRAARRAGTHAASMATKANNNATPTRVELSNGSTPNNIDLPSGLGVGLWLQLREFNSLRSPHSKKGVRLVESRQSLKLASGVRFAHPLPLAAGAIGSASDSDSEGSRFEAWAASQSFAGIVQRKG